MPNILIHSISHSVVVSFLVKLCVTVTLSCEDPTSSLEVPVLVFSLFATRGHNSI